MEDKKALFATTLAHSGVVDPDRVDECFRILAELDVSDDRPALARQVAERLDLDAAQVESVLESNPTPAEVYRIVGFRILAQHGEGRHGPLLSARYLFGKREVVLKILQPFRFPRSQDLGQMLLSAQRAMETAIAGVADVVHVGHPAWFAYVAQEPMTGASLQDVMKVGSVPVWDGVRWIARAARLMDEAHRRGLPPLGLRPGDVFIGADGAVRLTDVGLPKCFGDDGDRRYTAPEAWTDEQGRRRPMADVHNLAVMLSDVVEDPSPDLQAILDEALAPADQRTADLAAFAAALEGLGG